MVSAPSGVLLCSCSVRRRLVGLLTRRDSELFPRRRCLINSIKLLSSGFTCEHNECLVKAKFDALVHLVWTLFANISVSVRVCGVWCVVCVVCAVCGVWCVVCVSCVQPRHGKELNYMYSGCHKS